MKNLKMTLTKVWKTQVQMETILITLKMMISICKISRFLEIEFFMQSKCSLNGLLTPKRIYFGKKD